MEHDRYSDANFERYEYPCYRKYPMICMLSRKGKVNPENEIETIGGQRCYRQQTRREVYVAFPRLHEVNIVPLGDYFNGVDEFWNDRYV